MKLLQKKPSALGSLLGAEGEEAQVVKVKELLEKAGQPTLTLVIQVDPRRQPSLTIASIGQPLAYALAQDLLSWAQAALREKERAERAAAGKKEG